MLEFNQNDAYPHFSDILLFQRYVIISFAFYHFRGMLKYQLHNVNAFIL